MFEELDDDLLLGLRAGFERAQPEPTERSLPETIAGYRIVRELGAGGMGVVFEAEQEGLDRRVALKVARTSLRPGSARRFQHEARLLGRLQHPAIAEIYEAGACQVPGYGDIAYFAMALVEGARSITSFAEEEALGQRARIELVLDALEGVEHGHQRGVIHRDLKPSNLLVDADRRVRVIDFGLARRDEEVDELPSMHTRSGELLGTPHYMSPEQWLSSKSVDARTDVYSLGVVLFELLSGRLPYDLDGKTMLEIGDTIRARAPRSLGLSSMPGRRDLELVVQTAMAKDPRRRYPSARAFADDLRRYLSGRPIQARPPSTLYQVGSFARRHRALVAAVALVLVVSVVAAVVSTTFAVSSARRGALLEDRLYASQMARAYEAYGHGQLGSVRAFLDSVDVERRSTWEWRRLDALTRDESTRTIRDERLSCSAAVNDPVPALAPGPDGTHVVCGGDDGVLRVWSLDSGQVTREIAAHERPITSVSWSEDGAHLLSADAGGVVQLRDAATGELLIGFVATSESEATDVTAEAAAGATPSKARMARFGPDTGQVTVTVGHPQLVARVFDMLSGELLYESPSPSAGNGLAVPNRQPGGSTILIGNDLFTDVFGEDPRRRRCSGRATCISAAFAPDGRSLLLGNGRSDAMLWDIGDQRQRWSVRAHDRHVTCVAFSPDGLQVATGGADQSIKLWRGDDGAPLRTLSGHGAAIQTLHFLDDDRLVSSDAEGTIKTWSIEATGHGTSIPTGNKGSMDVALSDDGRRALVAGYPGFLEVHDLEEGRPPRTLSGHMWARSAALRPGTDEEYAVVAPKHLVRVYGEDGNTRFELAGSSAFMSLAYDPAGQFLFAGSQGGGLSCWRADTGEPVWFTRIGEDQLVALACNERWLAAAGKRTPLSLVDPTDGSLRWTADDAVKVEAVAFAPDGRHVVAAGEDGIVREYGLDGVGPTTEWATFSGAATTVAFSPCGTRLFAGYSTGIVRLWSRAGEELLAVRALDGAVRSLAWSADGETLVIVGDRSEMEVWRL